MKTKHSSKMTGTVVAVLMLASVIVGCQGQKKGSGELGGKVLSEVFLEEEETSDADGGIPDEPMTYYWLVNPGDECDGDVTVVRQSEGNQLVVMYATTSCDCNTLSLGVYRNGQYVFNYDILVGELAYDETKTGFSLTCNPSDNIIYNGYFGKDVAIVKEYDWGIQVEVDWNKVSEDQLVAVFARAIAEGPKEPRVLTAQDIADCIKASYEEVPDYAEGEE